MEHLEFNPKTGKHEIKGEPDSYSPDAYTAMIVIVCILTLALVFFT